MRTFMTCVAVLVFISVFNVAKSEVKATHTFIRRGDSGTLTIERKDQKTRLFSIQSTGVNCHTCDVSGSIENNVGTVSDSALDSKEPRCRISFLQQGDAITVQPITPESCASYCGVRASFEGAYQKPPNACSPGARRQRYEMANKQYKSGGFAKSENTLKALAADCGYFMSYIELDRVKNDLALAQRRQGDAKNCLATLKSTVASDFKNEADLKGGMLPCDFDNYIDVALSTWFNQRLCRKRLGK
jgi:hypothetical protein